MKKRGDTFFRKGQLEKASANFEKSHIDMYRPVGWVGLLLVSCLSLLPSGRDVETASRPVMEWPRREGRIPRLPVAAPKTGDGVLARRPDWFLPSACRRRPRPGHSGLFLSFAEARQNSSLLWDPWRLLRCQCYAQTHERITAWDSRC